MNNILLADETYDDFFFFCGAKGMDFSGVEYPEREVLRDS
jgi:hypothetical protein